MCMGRGASQPEETTEWSGNLLYIAHVHVCIGVVNCRLETIGGCVQ